MIGEAGTVRPTVTVARWFASRRHSQRRRDGESGHLDVRDRDRHEPCRDIGLRAGFRACLVSRREGDCLCVHARRLHRFVPEGLGRNGQRRAAVSAHAGHAKCRAHRLVGRRTVLGVLRRRHLVRAAAERRPKPIEIERTEFSTVGGRFSPDGRFIAYLSDQSGRYECVRPAVRGRGAAESTSQATWQISRRALRA